MDFPLSLLLLLHLRQATVVQSSDGQPTEDNRPRVEVDIRPLTADQLDGALALSTLMGWNQRLEDWRVLIELAPSGSFVARDHDRVVGTAIGIDYVHCGWIAMMLVAPEYRGRGLGARLLEAAMAAIPPQLPIRLDATPLGRPLYERHGFVLETPLTRYVRPAGMTGANARE